MNNATRWLRRIYRMLRTSTEDSSLRVKINSNLRAYGMVIPGNDVVTMELNHRKGEFVQTVIHECLHLTNADLTEKEVRALEGELFADLSDRQIGNLLRKVFNLLYWRIDGTSRKALHHS